MSMVKKDFNPFLYHSAILQDLFRDAVNHKNPAIWLYNHKARTSLFMLEALTRLHSKAFEAKFFQKWNRRFKKLEDLFGVMDEYIQPQRELKKNRGIDKLIREFFSTQSEKATNKCNKRLNDKGWLNSKISSFEKKIKRLDITYDDAHRNVLRDALRCEPREVLEFVRSLNFKFEDIEQVHEVRRKLRWLSMYAAAFRGLIQLEKSGKKHSFSKNYLTQEVLNSPFNKLELKPDGIEIILYDREKFMALSWLISELGNIKDKGILHKQLSDAVYVDTEYSRKEADEKANAILKVKGRLQAELLKRASEYTRAALEKDKILDNLIIE
jgi:hypothetical protein